MKIDEIFDKERFPPFLQCIPIFFYFPLGCTLAIIRFFIGIQALLLSTILSKVPFIRCFLLRIMCCVLGFIVFTEHSKNYDKDVKLIISNHITNFDHLAVKLLFNVCVPSVWNLPPYLNWILGYTDFGASEGRQILLKNILSFIKKSSVPVLIFPEGATTNGQRGLLKLNSWPFFLNDNVQPITLKVHRPVLTKISLSVLGSRWWSDMFWFLFVPYTVFTVRFLPVIHKADFENLEAFSKHVKEEMCKEVGLEETNFTSADKVEYAKLVLQR